MAAYRFEVEVAMDGKLDQNQLKAACEAVRHAARAEVVKVCGREITSVMSYPVKAMRIVAEGS